MMDSMNGGFYWRNCTYLEINYIEAARPLIVVFVPRVIRLNKRFALSMSKSVIIALCLHMTTLLDVRSRHDRGFVALKLRIAKWEVSVGKLTNNVTLDTCQLSCQLYLYDFEIGIRFADMSEVIRNDPKHMVRVTSAKCNTSWFFFRGEILNQSPALNIKRK